MIDLTVTGLDEMIAHLEHLRAQAGAGLRAYLLHRAEAARTHFEDTTPRRTGAAQAGWFVDDQRGAYEIAVVNPVVSRLNFPYPSALLTGTGQRGASATPAIGYLGGFAATPGMMPSAPLQGAWNYEATAPLATPAVLGYLPS